MNSLALLAFNKIIRIIRTITGLHFFLTLIFIVALLGMAFPYGFPMFFPLVALYFTLFFIRGKIAVRLTFGSMVILACMVLYLWGLLLTGGIFFAENKNDLANIAGGLMVLFTLARLDRKSYQEFINLHHKWVGLIFFVLSVLSLYKFYLFTKEETLGFVASAAGRYPWGSSLVTDYNMFAFAMYAGLLAAAYSFSRSRFLWTKIFYALTMVTCFMSIALSGSRRGWVILILLLAGLFITLAWNILKKARQRFSVQKLITNSFLVILSLALCIAIVSGGRKNIGDTTAMETLQYRFSSFIQGGFSDNFSSRTHRWDYSLTLTEEYSLFSLLLGDGFNYISDYGKQFDTDSGEDYPHNPILSSLHYSGLIGMLVAILMITLPLLCISRNIRMYGVSMLLLYFGSLLFFLPSGNSVFSYKYFLLMVLVIPAVRLEGRPDDSDSVLLRQGPE